MTLNSMPGFLPAVISERKRGRTRRFQAVTDVKAAGATYTPTLLANFVASQIVRASNLPSPRQRLRVIDPACGDGELLFCLLAQLAAIGQTNVDVFGFDTDAIALTSARQRISERFPAAVLHLRQGDFLDHAFDQEARSVPLVESPAAPQRYDLLIANPPYVRTQILGTEQAQLLARRFGLAGRVDLYHAFLLAIASVLEKGGTAGIIVSNRFMTTKGGGALREALAASLSIEHIWDLGDTKLFDAAVLPAVLLAHGKMRRREAVAPRFTSIYATNNVATGAAKDPIEAVSQEGIVRIADGRTFKVQHGTLDSAGTADSVWRISTVELDNWLATVHSNTWNTFNALGKIRVGIKTCADKVFIRDDWHERPDEDRPELLRSLITHHGARRFRARTLLRPRQVLYPHASVAGQKVAADLSQHPRSFRYLSGHRDVLESRRYLIEAGRHWYELWVSQDPALWELPKLVFRDISEEPCFWIDLDGGVVNGDCYWLAPDRKENESLLWLAAAVGNSKFIEVFYDHRFNNKLYAGRRRFMTQYVEQFPLPDPALPVSKEIIRLAREAFQRADEPGSTTLQAQLDTLVWKAFGLPGEDVSR